MRTSLVRGALFVLVAGIVSWTIFGCATGTGIESGAVELVGARMDKLEKLFENLSLQVTTTNNTQAENIYGGAGWVMLSGLGMVLCFGLILVVAFRSWLKHRRMTRSKELLTTSIDSLDEDTKRVVTGAIKRLVADKATKFSHKDQKNLREFVDTHKQDPTKDVE